MLIILLIVLGIFLAVFRVKAIEFGNGPRFYGKGKHRMYISNKGQVVIAYETDRGIDEGLRAQVDFT